MLHVRSKQSSLKSRHTAQERRILVKIGENLKCCWCKNLVLSKWQKAANVKENIKQYTCILQRNSNFKFKFIICIIYTQDWWVTCDTATEARVDTEGYRVQVSFSLLSLPFTFSSLVRAYLCLFSSSSFTVLLSFTSFFFLLYFFLLLLSFPPRSVCLSLASN